MKPAVSSRKKVTGPIKVFGPTKSIRPKKITALKTLAKPKKAGESKNTTMRKASKSRPQGTRPVSPSLPHLIVPEKKKHIGYFAAGSAIMVLGLLLASQNELKDESIFSENSVMNRAVAAQDTRRVSAGISRSVPVPSHFNKSPDAKNEQIIAQKEATGPLSDEFKLARDLNPSERIKFWSAYIEVGTGHQDKVAELANGYSIEDVAPIIPKKYNCTTFVETVAALSQSNAPEQFIDHLLAIRYKDGTANFYARNHLPESDWIPNNQRAGILKDITSEVAQAHGLTPQFSSKQIDRNKWVSARARKEGVSRHLASVREQASQISIKAQVPYIKLSQLRGVVDAIPDGTVINLVHEGDNRHSGVITHQGFLIREGNQYFLRHASSSGYIRSNDLFKYLDNLQKQKTRWPVKGVNLNQLSDSSSSTNRLSETM
ncbi:MAG: N-acetylmuramoyl-L-alanine amidase-like domain-containing protein [Bdellovibrionia bacterium]